METNGMASANTWGSWLPTMFSWYDIAVRLETRARHGGYWAISSISAMASPELKPSAGEPMIAADG
jgi:hypothetical protein